jgi:hypothetical protein
MGGGRDDMHPREDNAHSHGRRHTGAGLAGAPQRHAAPMKEAFTCYDAVESILLDALDGHLRLAGGLMENDPMTYAEKARGGCTPASWGRCSPPSC